MAITIANMSCIDFKQVSKKLTLTFKINIINVEQSIKVTVIVSSFLTNDKHFSLIIYMPSLVSLTLAHDITYLDPFLGPPDWESLHHWLQDVFQGRWQCLWVFSCVCDYVLCVSVWPGWFLIVTGSNRCCWTFSSRFTHTLTKLLFLYKIYHSCACVPYLIRYSWLVTHHPL